MSNVRRRVFFAICVVGTLALLRFAWWIRPLGVVHADMVAENGDCWHFQGNRTHRWLPSGEWTFSHENSVASMPNGSEEISTWKFGVFEMKDVSVTGIYQAKVIVPGTN